ncbi:MAG: DNA polymerase III subunit chi [Rhodocyclaceae bacterium]|nr:DNA polymerase III subunit chi [Rhodocyclaceae bacterium]MDZ4214732.1 DNA polymerase III subunit chi [Rhodocyclaceae bacterium]
MTHVEFLHGAPDRIQAAAHWLRQAWERRQSVLVYVPDSTQAAHLDRILWTQPQLSFLPHCRADSPLAAETPILLTDRLEDPLQENCLLNLSNELPPTFSRFEQLVEVVSIEDVDRLPARERFKFYRERGYPVESHDISEVCPDGR